MMQLMLIITFVPLLGMLSGCLQSVSAFIMPLQFKTIVYEVPVDKKIVIDDRRLYIEDIIYYEDGSLEMRYATLTPPLSKHRSWAWDITIDVEEARDYCGGYGSGHYLSGGYYSRGYKTLYDVDEEAQELIITYAYGRELKIDLTEGRVMAK